MTKNKGSIVIISEAPKPKDPEEYPSVFFITGVELKPLKSYHHRYVEYKLPYYNNDENAMVLDHRTFGWAPTYKEAEQWVLENAMDIAEGGTFQWAVIEGFTPGLYIYKPHVQVFFEFVGDWETDGHYEKIEGWPKEVEDYYESQHLVRVLSTIG